LRFRCCWIGFASHASKVRVAAPANSDGIQRNFERVLNDQWSNLRQTMVDRAAVGLDEDFRAGLDDWASRGEATAAWAFGCDRLCPSRSTGDVPALHGTERLQLQFLGLIDKKALQLVVRAADFDKLLCGEAGGVEACPLPTIGVTRYAVIHARLRIARMPSRRSMRATTCYTASGSIFTATISP